MALAWICGPRARHEAYSHVRAHRSDQGAPADHPERREQVPCMRGEKLETGLALRTRERMVVYQLVYYKISIKSSLQKTRWVKHKCFIEIIKVQEGYISFSLSTSRVETPELINMSGVGQLGAIEISQPVGSRSCNSMTSNGPSHGDESLCMPSWFVFHFRTRSPTTKNLSLTFLL
jgi:hypothetical protein